MSFGFSVGDFIAVFELANRVRKEFVDAPSQFKAISDDCRDVLGDLKKTLNKYSELKSSYVGAGSRAKRIWKRLKWEPDDIKELRSRIIVNVTLWNAFREKIDSQISVAIKAGVDQLLERQDGEESRKEYNAVLDWITLVNYGPQHNDFINRRHAETGKWLLESLEFKEWTETGNTLFCPGMPGAGKTILTSVVVDELNTRFRNDKSIAIAYLYCNFRQQHEQRAEDLLASLLKQLIQRQRSIPSSVQTLYKSHRWENKELSFDEIVTSLKSVAATTFSRVFVIVDALDECQVSDNGRTKFLDTILSLQAECQTSINIFATSRFIPEIKERFTDAIQREIVAHTEDNQGLQDEIKDKIANAVDGMFLLAKLYLDALKGKKSAKAIRNALAGLSTGFQSYDETYDKAYEDAMERIKGQIKDEKELAMQVIYWITCARTPLTTSQLEVALAIERGSSKLDASNICPVEDMVSVCAGLVTIDEESGIIRLVHYTTQQYFKRTQGKWFPQIESDIAAVCCTYLSFDEFGSGKTNQLIRREEENVLYRYAAYNWGFHAGEASMLIPEVAMFLEKQAQVEAASQSQLYSLLNFKLPQPQKMTGLHLAAYFGLEKAAKFLAGRQAQDLKDSNNRTPLSYAAENGHKAVVRLLLATDGIDPSSQSFYLMATPLYFAAGKGHETVVRLLLAQKGVDPESTDRLGRSAMSVTTKNGHEAVVRLLLATDGVDPSSKDLRLGATPLYFAAEKGHETVVRLLLAQKGVDPESEDFYGQSAKSLAVQYGHWPIVELLLKVDGVKVSEGGRRDRTTTLAYPVTNGHIPIFNLLLARCAQDGINPDTRGWNDGFTPLHIAAFNGNEEVVKLLLAQKGVNVNSLSNNVEAPFVVAADRGVDEFLKRPLFAPEGIYPDLNGTIFKRTVLQTSAERGHEGVVRLLLAHKGVNPDVYGGEESALSLATKKGHMGIVRLLQAHKSVLWVK
ncbi:hypothetical protein V493_02720 [Pseudogymnoascus sp. VKM F-4281 (FW-2241)]|nr:hypothetical protein V493_02720 [Pseudogymnoascus sp. VKM F-4281 (FW-2241)]